jgi:DNA-binding MarR family transcriptional regulator
MLKWRIAAVQHKGFPAMLDARCGQSEITLRRVFLWAQRQDELGMRARDQRVGPRSGALTMTALSCHLGYALRQAQGVILADLNHALAQLNLRPRQFAVLVLINQNPGTSQSNVSAALGIQKANFVATIADLENRGLVRRRKSEADGRTYSLGLTSRGRSVLLRAEELRALHEARVAAQIGSDGRLQLLTLLHRLAQMSSRAS